MSCVRRILLPDCDAATVAVGEDAMEGSLVTLPVVLNVLSDPALSRSYPVRKLAENGWGIARRDCQ